MYNPFKRNQPKARDPIPGWVKLVTLLFIAYAVVTNPSQKNPANSVASEPVQAAQNAVEIADEKISQYKNAWGKFGVALRVEDVVTGNGHPVVCGQEINLSYEAFHENGKPIGDSATSQKPYKLRIGSGKAMPALEQGVVGMAVGGKRRIFARDSLVYNGAREGIAKDETLRFDVEILSAAPELKSLDSAPFRMADTAIGSGGVIICGKPVRMTATVWSADGKKLLEIANPVGFTPGASEVPLGIEQGVIGMRRGGNRTLIIPPSMQKAMHGGKATHSFALPQPQTVIVDVAVN